MDVVLRSCRRGGWRARGLLGSPVQSFCCAAVDPVALRLDDVGSAAILVAELGASDPNGCDSMARCAIEICGREKSSGL